MIQLSMEEIAEVCSGRLQGETAGVYIDAVSTDTRTLQADDMFLALQGERFDASAFVQQALDKEAGALLLPEKFVLPPACETPAIFVSDTRKALSDLAAHIAGKTSTRVIAVTGSNGKTTTKDMIAHLLCDLFSIVSSPNSFNNDIGLPLTVLRFSGREDFAVVELGANHAGEISRLAKICRPEIGVITGIGRAHLEMFADLRGVATAKAELMHALPKNGTLFMNGDDEWCRRLQKQAPCKTVFFGLQGEHELLATDIRVLPGGVSFLCNRSTLFQIPVLGRHNVTNALSAIGVALRCGLDLEEITQRFFSFKPAKMRLQIEKSGGCLLLNDTYNANPDSMKAALHALCDQAGAKKKVAVLGDMLELGEHAETLHEEIGRLAADLKVDSLIAIGEYANSICRGAKGVPESIAYKTKDKVLQMLKSFTVPDSVILFKASRKMELESLIQEWKKGG